MASDKIIFFLALCAVIGDTFLSFAGRGGRVFPSSTEAACSVKEKLSYPVQQANGCAQAWFRV